MSKNLPPIEEGRPDHIVRLHRERLKTLRKAQEFSQADDIPHAVEFYNKYLNTLALYFDIDEKKLNPRFFDPKKDTAELLLISHVYWDLAKAYDRSPNLRHESVRCLDQFTTFTIGFKYQYVNAQMLKNFIKKKKAYDLKVFKVAHEKIRVNSKSCYVSTYCYGYDHPITNQLRSQKEILLKNKFGNLFVTQYYNYSPLFIKFSYKYPKIGNLLKKYIFKPLIRLFILLDKN